MNKKGTISEEVVLFIPRMLFIMVVVFAFVLLVKTLLVTKIDVQQLESDIFISRFMMSPNASAYYDSKIERAYPGIIDLNKFIRI